MNIISRTGLYFFLLLFTGFSFSSLQAAAAEQADAEPGKPVKKQYYIVEVVLFQHLNEQGKLDEFWHRPDIFDDDFGNNVTGSNELTDNRSNNVLTDDSPALAEYDMQNRHFLPLRNGIARTSAENYKLSDSAAHLRYSPDYKLLAHFGWTQRSLSKRQALPVRITANQFSDSLIPSGELKLYVSRYLHMEVNLQASQCDYSNEQSQQADDKALDEQLESGVSKLEIQAGMQNDNTFSSRETDSSQCVNKVYQFKQNRKMRSRELHYIDNPVFGMLVYVTPFTVNK